jgi:hypothetical protein
MEELQQRNQPYLDRLKAELGVEKVKQRWLHGLHKEDVGLFLTKNSPSYVGCVEASGELDTDTRIVDRLAEGLPASALISTDRPGASAKKTSGHWQVIYVQPGDHTKVQFFDSYGMMPTQPKVLEFLDRLCDKHKACYKWSKTEIQDTDSNACGYHCIYYILLRDYKKVSTEDMTEHYPAGASNKDKNDYCATLFCELMLQLLE